MHGQNVESFQELSAEIRGFSACTRRLQGVGQEEEEGGEKRCMCATILTYFKLNFTGMRGSHFLGCKQPYQTTFRSPEPTSIGFAAVSAKKSNAHFTFSQLPRCKAQPQQRRWRVKKQEKNSHSLFLTGSQNLRWHDGDSTKYLIFWDSVLRFIILAVDLTVQHSPMVPSRFVHVFFLFCQNP